MNERPAPHTLWSWIGVTAAIALPLTGLLGWLLWLFLPAYLLPIMTIWSALLVFLIAVYLPLRQRSVTFSLMRDQIAVTRGVFFVTVRRMRTDAVRQVTLLQGPLERRFDTAFLLISATGGHLLIEGIPRRQAEAWCKQLGAA